MGANSIGASASVGARTATARSSRPSAVSAGAHKHVEAASTTAAAGLADAARAPRASRPSTTDAPTAGAQALNTLKEHIAPPGSERPTIHEGRKKNGWSNVAVPGNVDASLARVRGPQGGHPDMPLHAPRTTAPLTDQVLDSVTAEAGITIDEEQLASPQAQEQLARIEERLAKHADDPDWLNMLVLMTADNLSPDASAAEVLRALESTAMLLDGWVGRKKNG